GRGRVALRELCAVGLGLGPNQVGRDNARRLIVIRCNTLGRDLAGVVGDIRQRVNERVRLPEGYFVEYGGQFESQQRATTLITLLALGAGGGLFLGVFMLYPPGRVGVAVLQRPAAGVLGGRGGAWRGGEERW